MAALTSSRGEFAKYGAHALPDVGEGPLAASVTIYKGAILVRNAAGFLKPGTGVAGEIAVGVACEDVVNAGAAGDKRTAFERGVFPFANSSAGDAIADPLDCEKVVYIVDDQTVAKTDGSGTRSAAGKVERIEGGKVFVRIGFESTVGAPSVPATLAAFVAGDTAPASVLSGATYDVPTTAANSTITLPAAAADGTVAYFVADGVKNGHTVTYRDATGTVALTTALTLSKRHLVIVSKAGGLWFANAYVSP